MKRGFSCCLYIVAVAVIAAPAAAGLVAFGGQFIDEAELAEYEALMPEAEAVDAPDPETPSWGLVNWSSWNMGPSDAATRDGVLSYTIQNGSSLEYNGTTGTASFSLPVHLPQGSLVSYVYVWYYDNYTSNPSMGFYRGTQTGGFTSLKNMDCGSSNPNLCAWAGGNTRGSYSGFSHTTNNWLGHYFILSLFPKSGASETRFYQATVWYKLQISPAPGSASFNDVPVGAQFFREIEALADSGITLGCTATNFCPGAAVTRGQMAAFLARAFGLAWPADQ
ncbi:MAG: S-layer homology domain-containing protein [Thermoanaerobaculia bacterium]